MRNSRMKQLQMIALALILIAVGLATSGSDGTGLPALTVYVDATTEWNFTGLTVKTGQKISVNTVGYACTSVEYGFGSTSDPGGQTDRLGCGLFEGAPPPCALNYAPYGMLIGKVVNSKGSQTFAIGNANKITIPVDGHLYLSVNDNLGFYDDNAGHYLVTLK